MEEKKEAELERESREGDMFTKHCAGSVSEFEGMIVLECRLSSGHAM